jgi:hypothetical protein
MTSREHARHLMHILLSSPAGPAADSDGMDEHTDERTADRQTRNGHDDSTEEDERRTTALVEALILT